MQKSEQHDSNPSGKKELRLWPGVAAISVQWLCWVVVPLVVPGPATGFISVGGGAGRRLGSSGVVGVPEPSAAS